MIILEPGCVGFQFGSDIGPEGGGGGITGLMVDGVVVFHYAKGGVENRNQPTMRDQFLTISIGLLCGRLLILRVIKICLSQTV